MNKYALLFFVLSIPNCILICLLIIKKKDSKNRLQTTINYCEVSKNFKNWFDKNPKATREEYLIQKRIEEKAYGDYFKIHGY
jgi:hypothetical protein